MFGRNQPLTLFSRMSGVFNMLAVVTRGGGRGGVRGVKGHGSKSAHKVDPGERQFSHHPCWGIEPTTF